MPIYPPCLANTLGGSEMGAGSIVDAGYRAADLMTLVSSAARNDLDVFHYMKDVLDRLLAGETNYEAIRADVWKESHPEPIRLYRVEERPSRAAAAAIRFRPGMAAVSVQVNAQFNGPSGIFMGRAVNRRSRSRSRP
jgi:hypothetical protein